MSNIEKIRQEIERLKKYSKSSKKEWIDEGYNQNAFAEDCRIKSFDKLLAFIDSLPEEKPSEDLEEAAKEYSERVSGGHHYRDLTCGFIAGAEWDRQQMLKGAKDGYVSAIIIHNDGDEEHYAVTYPNGERTHSITDKVKIIIL